MGILHYKKDHSCFDQVWLTQLESMHSEMLSQQFKSGLDSSRNTPPYNLIVTNLPLKPIKTG